MIRASSRVRVSWASFRVSARVRVSNSLYYG